MAFANFNGYTVPILEGSVSMKYIDGGSASRSASGNLLVDRRYTKRVWSMTTTPLTELVAKALEGIIRGEGHVLPFNAWADTPTRVDYWSNKGLAPSISGDTTGHLRYNVAADGASIFDADDVREGAVGNGSIEVGAAVTNLCSANVSGGTDDSADTTDWTAIGAASIASSTTYAVQGTRSLNIGITAINQGAEEAGITVVDATAYTASCYVRTSGTNTVRLQLRTGATMSTITKTCMAGQWYRLQVTHTSAGTTADVEIISIDIGAFDMYIDCVQLEAGSRARPWVLASHATRNLRYPVESFAKYHNATINLWAKADNGWVATVAQLIQLGGAGLGLSLTTDSSPGEVQASAGAWSDILSYDIGWDDGLWHMITAIMRQDPDTGENSIELYTDGVLRDSGTDTTPQINTADWTGVHIGHNAGSYYFPGAMEQVQLLPYAVPADVVAAWYAMQNTDVKAMPITTRVYLDGSILPDVPYAVQIKGKVTASYKSHATVEGTWRDNGRVLKIEAIEI